MNVARILLHARRRARLTQRQLADAAGVPQSTVARIEAGTTMPRVDTFDRLLGACGMGLELMHKLGEGVDVTLIEDLLDLAPEDRIRRGLRTAAHLREVGLGRRT